MESLSPTDVDRIIEMAWEDRTPFEAIAYQFQLPESEVITLMRQELKASAFKRWRRRVQGRTTKHIFKRGNEVTRFKCNRQRAITGNKISKKNYWKQLLISSGKIKVLFTPPGPNCLRR